MPEGKADGDRRIEVSTTSRCTGDDGEGDADGESPANLEDAPENRRACRSGGVQVGARHGGDTGEDVEEDACCLGQTFSQPARASVLEVELALGDWWRWDDVTGDMALKHLCNTDLNITCCLPGQIGWIVSGCHFD